MRHPEANDDRAFLLGRLVAEGVRETYVERAGFDLLERLKAQDPDVRLVFCTSPRAVRVFSAEAVAAGAVDIVTDCSELYGLVGL